MARQIGFGIEGVHVAHTAIHKEEDHRFGFGRKHRRFGREGVGALPLKFGGEQIVPIEQRRERQA